MISPELLDAYKWHRRVPSVVKASTAIVAARNDVAARKLRYPSSSIHNVCRQSGPNYGRNYAWIEDPAAIGLRFVGHADEIVRSIQHEGWFTDDDFQDETLRGGVWQFPARKGCPLYVAGYSDPNNEGAAFVCLDLIEGERGGEDGPMRSDARRSAAIQADSIAENAAEREREYRAASNARMQFEELADEIASTRSDLLAVLGERRVAKSRDPDGFPALCKLIRRSVQRGLQDIEDARKKRAELALSFDHRAGWANY